MISLRLHRSNVDRARCRGWTQRFACGLSAAVVFLIYNVPSRAQTSGDGVTLRIRSTTARIEQGLEQVRIEVVRFPDTVVQMAFTDGNGGVDCAGLEPGSYRVRASKQGYVAEEVKVELFRHEGYHDLAIQLRRENDDQPSPAGGMVAARILAIPEGARSSYERGAKKLSEKDAPASVQFLQDAIAKYPSYYEAHFLLGMAHIDLKNLPAAEKSLSTAVVLEPKFLPPYHPLAVVLMSEKRFDDAEKTLRKASELDPSGWQWPYELAKCYAKRMDWDDALAQGLSAREKPNAPSHVLLLLADIYSNTGRAGEAVALLEEFEKRDPGSPFIGRVREVLPRLREQARAKPEKP
jgi:tetratricopeptide (TPR) repeat protein